MFTFAPLTPARAEQLVAWRYEAPYDLYNVAEGQMATILDPAAYFAADDDSGRLLGFCCFGPDARVSGGSYGEETGLDIGVGLRPDATGRGIGPEIIRAALDLGESLYGAHRFGATVAAFNERAQRAAQRAGFRITGAFVQEQTGREWVQFVVDR